VKYANSLTLHVMTVGYVKNVKKLLMIVKDVMMSDLNPEYLEVVSTLS